MLGFETSTKDIILNNGTKITLKLIDTAGQEKYQSLTTNYIRNADGVLFIFSHESRDSFNNIKRWVNSFKDNNDDNDFDKEFPAYLIGNKCDLEHVVDDYEINQLKDENNFCVYTDTNAKEDIGIDKVFYEMGEKLIKTKGDNKKRQKVKRIVKYKKKKNVLTANSKN